MIELLLKGPVCEWWTSQGRISTVKLQHVSSHSSTTSMLVWVPKTNQAACLCLSPAQGVFPKLVDDTAAQIELTLNVRCSHCVLFHTNLLSVFILVNSRRLYFPIDCWRRMRSNQLIYVGHFDNIFRICTQRFHYASQRHSNSSV